MKILILANNDVGLYQFRKELIERLLESNVVLISLPYGDLVRHLQESGCRFIDTPIERRGMNPIKDLSLFKRYAKMLKKEKPDLVITYTIKPNVYGGFACRLLRVPYAVNITGLGTAFQNPGILKTLVTVMYKAAMKKAKVVFFENSANKQILLDGKMVKENQCIVLNGAGVNLEKFAFVSYPEDEDTVRFLFMGRVMKEKGIDELLSAMDRLYKEGINCSLDILGNYEEDYKIILDEYQKNGWLHYHGYQQNVKPFIENCHCFVLPSYHEGMANTNLECSSMGRPIITSDIPGCREAVIDGKSGFLCKAQDVDSLYKKMKEFCTLDRQAKADMGKAARQHMEAVFDKKKVVEKTIEELYK